jgi:hypothetical protein
VIMYLLSISFFISIMSDGFIVTFWFLAMFTTILSSLSMLSTFLMKSLPSYLNFTTSPEKTCPPSSNLS